MDKTFEYVATKVCEEELDVVNIGNCFIEAFDFQQNKYYIWIKTELGTTKILEAGPYINDPMDLKQSNISFETYPYSEYKITGRIRNFLNNPKYKIVTAMNMQEDYDEQKKIELLYNISEYMQGEL